MIFTKLRKFACKFGLLKGKLLGKHSHNRVGLYLMFDLLINGPYRQLFKPLLDLLDELSRLHPTRTTAVVIPEMVEARWYDIFLHNHRAAVFKTALLFSGRSRVAVINLPLYIS